jgi:hypothetical protein
MAEPQTVAFLGTIDAGTRQGAPIRGQLIVLAGVQLNYRSSLMRAVTFLLPVRNTITLKYETISRFFLLIPRNNF